MTFQSPFDNPADNPRKKQIDYYTYLHTRMGKPKANIAKILKDFNYTEISLILSSLYWAKDTLNKPDDDVQVHKAVTKDLIKKFREAQSILEVKGNRRWNKLIDEGE